MCTVHLKSLIVISATMATNQHPLFDLGQQSMLRMIRSARSRLGRESSVEDQGRTSSGISNTTSERRSSKSSSTARAAFGGVGRRLSRSREPESQNSENVAPEKLPQPPAAGTILGALEDATNRMGKADADKGIKLGATETGPAKAAPAVAPAAPRQTPEIDPDAMYGDNAQYVTEYCVDIHRKLQREEGLHQAAPGYMERHLHVNSKMRGILNDWLVSVQQKYKLKGDTLYLTVNVLDRFLEKKPETPRRFLQLAGVTALLIAAKYEEIHPPQLADLVYVTDKAYTKEDIIKMEVCMLTTLDFKVCSPTPLHFLERYVHVNGCDETHKDLAQYLLELSLPEYNMLRHTASSRAAAAVYLSNKLLRHSPSWNSTMVKHTHFTEAMIKDCAKELCAILEGAETNPLQAIRKKYSNPKYHSVAKLNFAGSTPASQGDRRRSLTGTDGRYPTEAI